MMPRPKLLAERNPTPRLVLEMLMSWINMRNARQLSPDSFRARLLPVALVSVAGPISKLVTRTYSSVSVKTLSLIVRLPADGRIRGPVPAVPSPS